jgi:hypothetical protein
MVLALCLAQARAAQAQPDFDLALGAYLDDASGRGFDLDAGFSPNATWTFGAGIGKAQSAEGFADLDARVVRSMAQVQGDALGARATFNSWDDSGEFESRTLAGTLFWRRRGWQFGALLEDRRLEVDYVVALPLRSVALSHTINGDGYGVDLGYYGERWGAYLRAVSYRYDDSLDRLIAASQQPNLERFPRIAALVGSLLTRAAGALDRDLQVGIDRVSGRSGVRVDVSFYEDAISQADGRGVSASYQYTVTPHVTIEATLGYADSDDLDPLGYGGLRVRFRN